MAAGELRISDEDRERASATLREHFGVGRLDQDELDERVRGVYAAKTEAQLAALLADMPALPVTSAQAKHELAERRRQLRLRVLQQSGGGVGVFALCTAIWAVTSPGGFFWPAFVLIAIVAPLVRRGWALYGPGADLDELEAALDREKNKDRDEDD